MLSDWRVPNRIYQPIFFDPEEVINKNVEDVRSDLKLVENSKLIKNFTALPNTIQILIAAHVSNYDNHARKRRNRYGVVAINLRTQRQLVEKDDSDDCHDDK